MQKRTLAFESKERERERTKKKKTRPKKNQRTSELEFTFLQRVDVGRGSSDELGKNERKHVRVKRARGQEGIVPLA